MVSDTHLVLLFEFDMQVLPLYVLIIMYFILVPVKSLYLVVVKSFWLFHSFGYQTLFIILFFVNVAELRILNPIKPGLFEICQTGGWGGGGVGSIHPYPVTPLFEG